MKRINKYFLLCLLVFVLATTFFIFKSKKIVKTTKDLINISELSNEFMDDYFSNVEVLSQSENKDNVLIIISEDEIKNDYGASNVVKGPNNQYYVEYATEEEKNLALEKFKDNKSVLSVEENVTLELSDIEFNSWGLTTMKMSNAIEAANSINAPEVVVAVIDSGLTTSLANRYYSGKTKATYNVLTNETTNMTDSFGHGTHVYGTIAEGTPDNVKIIVVKVTNGQTLSLLDLITGINYVTYTNKADVINLSLGGYDYLESLEQAIEAAKQLNIITVAAAGNDNVSTAHYPSSLSNTISISAVNQDLSKADYSNYGDTITFAAPGTNIKSIMSIGATIAQNNGNNSDNDHEIISGTSMAAPHASAAVAILKSFNKNLTFTNVVDLLKKYSIDLGVVGKDQYFGYGLVSFEGAVFCTDGIDCDEYNVFKNIVKKLELATTRITPYNYGSINNLLGTSIKIYYNNTDYVTKYLWELDNLTISNYDPYKVGSQTVTLNYGGVSTNMTVSHSSSYPLGWTYAISNNKAVLTGYTDNEYNIGKLYVPSRIADKDVSTINNCFDSSNDINSYKEIILPSTLTNIGANAFMNKANIEKVTTLATSVNIGEYAFASASSLKEFSGSMNTIGASAFLNCINLDTITLNNYTTSIGSYAFYNTKLSSITIPRNVTLVSGLSFGGNNKLTSISVNSNNNKYDSRNNCNCIIETNSNTLIKGINTTTIPSTVVAIGSSAFNGDPRITSVVIPNNITAIGSNAYSNTSLDSITIPRTVTSIGDNAFSNTEVTIYTYTDANAKTYAINNSIRYETLNPSKVELDVNKNAYVAFETVEDGDISNVKLYYSRGYYSNNEYINSEYTNPENVTDYNITYQNGDYFNYGDTYYTISGTNAINETYTKNIEVTVSKAIPTYTVPDDIEGVRGSKLSTVILPDHFEWMDSSIVITDNTVTYYAKYNLNDNNYSVVNNIPISINITDNRSLLVPNIVISNKTYDGTTSIDDSIISISNLGSNDYTITNAYINNANNGNRTAYITIRLTDDKFDSVYLEGGLQEKEYIVNMTIVPKVITKPTLKNITYTYTGLEQTLELNNFDNSTMNISNNKRTIAGFQDVTVSLKDTNYVWNDNTTEALNFHFTINQASVVISDNTTDVTVLRDGDSHTIDLVIDKVDGAIIKYKDSNGDYTLDDIPTYTEIGSYIIYYKVYKDDNYTTYYSNKTLTIYMSNINIISSGYEGYYDGKSHTININNTTSGVTIKYSTDGINYNLNELPKYNNIGEYTIYYKATKAGYYEVTDSNKVRIYGIKDLSKLSIKNNTIIVYNETFNTIKNKFDIYANTINYSHYDSSNKSINSEAIKTGDKMHIVLNGNKVYDYPFAVKGDVTGDGKINYLDYVSVYNHIQKVKHPELSKKLLVNEYLLAADMSDDDKINYLDYVKIYNRIKELKGGTN